jgi:hypothetical protein
MSHAFGEMYYLAMQMDHKRQIEMQKGMQQGMQQNVQERDPRKGALVFISPRVPKEFDTVVPSDTGKPVGTERNPKGDTEDACIIM